MKKHILKYLLFASLMLVFCSATGCEKKDVSTSEAETVIPNEVVFADFEEWYPDFSNISIYNDFGKVSVNATDIYVSSGERSVRLDPLGGKNGGSAPIVVFGTESEKTGKDISDFSYADYVTFDIYNPQDETTIYAGFIYEIVNVTTIQRTNEQEILLSHGWNRCTLNVEASLLDLVGNLDNVQGMYLRFSPVYAADIIEEGEDKTPRYYVDNIVIVNKNTKSQVGYKIKLENGEIADFENLYQQYMFSNDNPGEVEVVNASDYNLTAPSGRKMLRVTFKGLGEDSSVWQQMNISEALLRASELYEMDSETAAKAYLCFDVYSNNQENHSMAFVFRTSDSQLTASLIENEPGQWTSFEYCLGDLLSYQANYLSTFGPFQISYKTNFEGECEYFFDNFRIEVR